MFETAKNEKLLSAPRIHPIAAKCLLTKCCEPKYCAADFLANRWSELPRLRALTFPSHY